MHQPPVSVLTKIRLIEERLARIESHLDLEPAPPKPTEVSAPPESPALPIPTPPAAPLTSAPAAITSPPAVTIPTSPIEPIAPVRMPAERAPSTSKSFEQVLGGRIFAIAGALIIVLGVTFFIKLAWDNGWIHTTPTGRCIAAAIFGFVLLGCAEAARRMVNALTAIGLNIAGLATLYITSFGALALYDLVSMPIAFALLAGTGLLGVAISVRAKYVSVAGLSLGAAYLAPFLLFEMASENPSVVMIYDIALFAVALSIASWPSLRLAKMRTIGWCLHLPIAGLWCLGSFAEHPLLTLTIIGLTWVLANADIIALAARTTSTRSDDQSDLDTIYNGKQANVIGASMAFTVSLWTFLIGLITILDWRPDLDWILPASMLAAMLLLTQAHSGVMRSLRDKPKNHLERLAIGYITQAGAFLIITVALATNDWMTAVCWLAMAVAAAATERFAGAKRLAIFSYITLVIGALHTIILTPWSPSSATPHVLLGGANGLFLTRGTLMIAANALAIGLVGYFRRDKINPSIVAGIVCAFLGASVVNAQSNVDWIAGA